MTNKNTPNNNGREIRPNPRPQSFPNVSSIPDASKSTYRILNWDRGILDDMELGDIQVDNMVIVIGISEEIITVLGKVDIIVPVTEEVLPMKLLGSECAEILKSKINNEICSKFDKDMSGLPLQYMGLNRDTYNMDSFNLTDNELWKLPDSYDDMPEKPQKNKPHQRVQKNQIFFEKNYHKEGIETLKIGSAEYVYQFGDFNLDIMGTMSSKWKDGSMTCKCLSIQEIEDRGLDVAETIISSEGGRLEDFNIFYRKSNQELINIKKATYR